MCGCGRVKPWAEVLQLGWVMLKTAGEAAEAGDVKTGWVRLSTSATLRLITSDEAGERRRWATTLTARRARRQTDRRPPRRVT